MQSQVSLEAPPENAKLLKVSGELDLNSGEIPGQKRHTKCSLALNRCLWIKSTSKITSGQTRK